MNITVKYFIYLWVSHVFFTIFGFLFCANLELGLTKRALNMMDGNPKLVNNSHFLFHCLVASV